MLNGLKNLFMRGDTQAKPEPHADALAVAALMIEAARADESYTDEERTLVEQTIVRQFGVDAAAAAPLRETAEAMQKEANDLHRFTKVVKALPADVKLDLVESLWRIALSDATRHSWEDTLIRRVCGLLYVSDVDSGLARRRVEADMKDRAAKPGAGPGSA